MGGKGSGAMPGQNSNHRGGMPKKAAVAVTGSGVPIKPMDLPREIDPVWDEIAEQVQGVAFAQDSDAITEMAWLTWQKREFQQALLDQPCDDEKTRLNLAVGRSLSALWSQFGLTPRSRQILLVPKDEEEKDEFEEMMEGRGE